MHTFGCGVLTGLVLLLGQAQGDDGASLAPLYGKWKVVKTTMSGKPITDKQITDSQMTFKSGELTWESGDGSGRERFEIEPEAGTDPPAFHVNRVEPANRPQSGRLIYELQDDRLRIAFFDALQGRPVSFQPAPELIVIELEKIDSPQRVEP